MIVPALVWGLTCPHKLICCQSPLKWLNMPKILIGADSTGNLPTQTTYTVHYILYSLIFRIALERSCCNSFFHIFSEWNSQLVLFNIFPVALYWMSFCYSKIPPHKNISFLPLLTKLNSKSFPLMMSEKLQINLRAFYFDIILCL